MASTQISNENPIRVLRRALGLTQHRFADELGCSYSSVQGYEGGRNVPATMLEKMVAIARSRRLPDLADFAIVSAYALTAFIAGGLFFRHLKRGFADVL